MKPTNIGEIMDAILKRAYVICLVIILFLVGCVKQTIDLVPSGVSKGYIEFYRVYISTAAGTDATIKPLIQIYENNNRKNIGLLGPSNKQEYSRFAVTPGEHTFVVEAPIQSLKKEIKVNAINGMVTRVRVIVETIVAQETYIDIIVHPYGRHRIEGMPKGYFKLDLLTEPPIMFNQRK